MADSNTARRFTDSPSEASTVIGRGLSVQGEVTGPASLEVWGRVEGTVGTEGLLWVRDGGEVVGEVAANNVVIEGEVRGTIYAKEKAELRATSKVHADLAAQKIAIAEGAFFEGQIRMLGAGDASRMVSFREKRER